MTLIAPPPTADRAGLRRSAEIDGSLLMALANAPAALDQARLALRAYLSPVPLGPRAINRLEVVFEELVTNILRHGFAPGADHTILVRAAVRTGTIELTFEDDGTSFNPVEAPAPLPLGDLAAPRLGGFGLPAVRRFCGAMSYEASPRPALCSLGGAAFSPVNRLTVSIAIAED